MIWKNDLVKIIPILEKGAHDQDEENLKEKIIAHKVAKKQYEEKKGNKMPNVIAKLSRDMDESKKKIPPSFCYDESFDLESESKKIVRHETYIEDQWKSTSEMAVIVKDMENKKIEIEKLERKIAKLPPSNIDIRRAKEMIKEMDANIDSLYVEISTWEKVILELNKYNQYLRHNIVVNEWKEKIEKGEKEVILSERLYSAALILKNKCHKAEIMALKETIENINEHARYYLGMMFVHEKICVRLENFKKTKKSGVKCKMNVHVEYKGFEYDSIEQLSGGERERVALAFILAVNSMMNSRVLMLDESLSSLDANTNSEIFTLLRDEVAKNKLVVVVSHEANRGIFDHVYNLEI